MKILEVADRTPDLINQLLKVWEKSVRATHLFLSDREIKISKSMSAGVEWDCTFDDCRR